VGYLPIVPWYLLKQIPCYREFPRANTTAMGIKWKKLRINKKYPFHQPIRRQHSYIRWNYELIYHVWEGYLRKISVERRKISSRLGKFSVSRLVFFANSPPNMIYLFNYTEYYLEHWLNKYYNTLCLSFSGIFCFYCFFQERFNLL